MRRLGEDKNARIDSVVVIDVMILDLMLVRDIFYRASNGFCGMRVAFPERSLTIPGGFFSATNIHGFVHVGF